MARVTIIFSVSLPPELAETLKETIIKERRSRSEIIREALRRYFILKSPAKTDNIP